MYDTLIIGYIITTVIYKHTGLYCLTGISLNHTRIITIRNKADILTVMLLCVNKIVI